MAKQTQTQTAKATANKTATATAKAKPATAKKTETKTESRMVFVPLNRPTAGGYLFAFTYAAMLLVLSLPKAKQAAAARYIHGATAMRYHGENGTKRIVVNADNSVTYDKGYFTIGAKGGDDKRKAVPESWAESFAYFFANGEMPKTPKDNFAFKATGKQTLNIGLK